LLSISSIALSKVVYNFFWYAFICSIIKHRLLITALIRSIWETSFCLIVGFIQLFSSFAIVKLIPFSFYEQLYKLPFSHLTVFSNYSMKLFSQMLFSMSIFLYTFVYKENSCLCLLRAEQCALFYFDWERLRIRILLLFGYLRFG
jgi:hypothetical protein